MADDTGTGRSTRSGTNVQYSDAQASLVNETQKMIRSGQYAGADANLGRSAAAMSRGDAATSHRIMLADQQQRKASYGRQVYPGRKGTV
jgi:hypothetical protein